MQKTNHTYQNETIQNRATQNEIIQSNSTKDEKTQKEHPSKELKNFKLIQDAELLSETMLAAQNEKAAMIELLEHLCEIDRRKLYASLNYNSLFKFIHKYLGYSESQASDRVNTVRLMNQNRGVKEQLATGGLNLTTAAQLQRFIQKEKKVNPEILELKESLIAQCQGQSKKSVEQIIIKHASESTILSMKERTRTIDSENMEFKFIADLEFQSLLKRAKELFYTDSHAVLMKFALKALILKKEEEMGKDGDMIGKINKDISRSKEDKYLETLSQSEKQKVENNFEQKEVRVATRLDTKQKQSTKITRYIPVRIKHQIFQRANFCCQWPDCKSQSQLEIDHIQPIAKGGQSDMDNLRILCRTHNQRAAIQLGLI